MDMIMRTRPKFKLKTISATFNRQLTDKPMNTSAKHPTGLTVLFDEDRHIYTVAETGQVLTSGTTFIGRFFPKFNAEKVANKIAEKRNTTPQQLLNQWNKKRDNACDCGTFVHLYAEMLINGDQLPIPRFARERRLCDQAARAVVALLKRFDVIEAEKIVFSPTLGIAGTIDLLLQDRVSKNIIIADWKQNEKIDRDNEYGEKAYSPIDYMDACSLNKYRIQLNLYQFILIHEGYYPAVPNYRRLLIHLQEGGFHGIKINDLQQVIAELVFSEI